MPEMSADAAILIATSWQALQRTKFGQKQRLITNCAATLVFAAFYLEASLSALIENMGKTDDMRNWTGYGGPKKPGLGPSLERKLAWYYNEYVANIKAPKWNSKRKKKLKRYVRRRFLGFADLHRIRNDISHGKVPRATTSLTKTQDLRDKAKAIVSDLLAIAKENDHDVEREVDYRKALAIVKKLYTKGVTE